MELVPLCRHPWEMLPETARRPSTVSPWFTYSIGSHQTPLLHRPVVLTKGWSTAEGCTEDGSCRSSFVKSLPPKKTPRDGDMASLGDRPFTGEQSDHVAPEGLVDFRRQIKTQMKSDIFKSWVRLLLSSLRHRLVCSVQSSLFWGVSYSCK